MQITSGVRSVLSFPIVYKLFQYMMGAKQGWTYLASSHIRAKAGDNILDVGCGPADILEYLPCDVNYWGVDISQSYIASAKAKYGHKANLSCKYLTYEDILTLPKFDVVIATGLLHHMSDAEVLNFLELAKHSLKKGGRLVTVDPCYTEKQSYLARFLISKDRGQNVRTEFGYTSLINLAFKSVRLHVKHRGFIPYTHCYIECTKN